MDSATAFAIVFAIGTILGQQPKTAGEVQRFGWPRTDLQVTVDGVPVQPGLALGSWAAFSGSMVMGDLVLKPGELDGVIRALEAGGIEITAIHNHLSNDIAYVHFHGEGDPDKLATALKSALATTSTPLGGGQPAPPVQSDAFDVFMKTIGRKGTVNGKVLQFSVPRSEAITEGAMTIPPAMGVATAINVQQAGDGVAASGDFVLIAAEVNPVIRELQAKGIRVTALHSHMLRETPRLFFMHFWGAGSAATIAEGLRNAIARTNSK
jgi:hypothetical protein